MRAEAYAEAEAEAEAEAAAEAEAKAEGEAEAEAEAAAVTGGLRREASMGACRAWCAPRAGYWRGSLTLRVQAGHTGSAAAGSAKQCFSRGDANPAE